MDADFGYVGDASMVNLLALWPTHGVDAVLTELVAQHSRGRLILTGTNYWHEGSSTDSFGPELRPLRDDPGLLPVSFCPHLDGVAGQRESCRCGDVLPLGWAADDGAALVWRGGAIQTCLSKRACGRHSALIVREFAPWR